MDNRHDAKRVIVAFLIIIVALGSIAVITCLANPPGQFPSLLNGLAVIALGLTCLLCYPLVFAYWIVSGRTTGMRDLLILHSVVVAAFIGWYVAILFD
ncbi:hypothetical protein J4P02_22730 [Pseudomonas sp. NFXW11]|uniref:hypothetical protein n=1 Tax=Pseudomonas sp. NFXW11 TaxID=2819531 RepID=UPI003CF9F7AB